MVVRRAALILVVLAFLSMGVASNQTSSVPNRGTRQKIYTLRDPTTGQLFDFKLDHCPSITEQYELIDKGRREESRRIDLLLQAHRAITEIEAGPQVIDSVGHVYPADLPSGFQPTLDFGEGELESIPEAFVGLAPRPLSVVPLASDFWEPGDAHTRKATAAEWFRDAGERLGFGYLVLFLVIGYALCLSLARFAPGSPATQAVRWFFVTPIIRPTPVWMVPRNWIKWIEGSNAPAGACCLVLLILSAAGTWPNDFYTIVRLVVCVSSVFFAVAANATRQRPWSWLMTANALLFNPVLPLHLLSSTWRVVDIVVALEFLTWLITHRHAP